MANISITPRHRRNAKDPVFHNTLMALKEMKVRQKQDLVRLIKELYTRPNTDAEYETCRVKKRSPSQYGSDQSETTWEEKRRNRLYSQTCGHFSANHEAYRTMGTVVLDPGELLIKIMEESLPKEFLNEYRSGVPGDSSHLNKYLDKKEDKHSQANAVISLQDQHRRQTQCRASGYSDIKRVLKETEERMAVCRAGQSYSRHLRMYQHKKDAERKLRNENAHVADVMVVRQLSSDTLLANMDTGDDNDDPLPSSPTHVAFERKGALAVCQGEKFLRPHMVLASNKRRTVAAENSRAHKRQWTFWVKLENIDMILSCLYNMRSRHLKSKTPLTRKTLLSLQKDPFQEKTTDVFPGDQSRFSYRTTTNMNGSHDVLSSRFDVHGPEQRAVSRKSIMESHVITPRSFDGSTHAQKQDSYRSRDGSRHAAGPSVPGMGPPKTTNTPLGGMSGKTFFRRKTKAFLSGLTGDPNNSAVMETWEDMVNYGYNNKTKMIKLAKKIPPWQRQLNCDDVLLTVKKPKPKQSEEEEHDEAMIHREATVNRLQLSFLSAKEKLKSTVEQDIERVEREQAVKSRYKLAAFDNLHPLFDQHKRRLKETDEEATKDPELVQEEKADWYELLVQEARAAGLVRDHSIKELLNQLNRYVHNKPSNIHHIKEKFCLLCISLPVYEICNATMQQSLQFVIERVLGSSKDVLATCLDYRLLYVL